MNNKELATSVLTPFHDFVGTGKIVSAEPAPLPKHYRRIYDGHRMNIKLAEAKQWLEDNQK